MAWGTFKLSELRLDQQNIRTGEQPDQRAAFIALLADQKQMLVNLALDLLDVGPSPGEPIWVTADPDNAGQQIVLEGNRRVAALKMMDNPQLAAGTDYADEFGAMAKEFAEKPRRELEAQVFASREDAWPWIERRHMSAASGVGLQPWSSLALERHKLAGGGSIRRSLLVLNFLDDGSPAFEEVGAVINAKATTVDRVLNAPAMADALGVRISRKDRSITFENGDQVAGRRLLRDLVTSMARSDFTFSKVRDAKDRDAWVRGFGDRSVRAAGSAPPSTTPLPSPSSGTVVPFTPRSRLKEPARATLAPGGDRAIALVKGDRLKALYRECRHIKLEGNQNAAALLLRVFIELSSEALLNEKGAPLPTKVAGRGVTDWGEHGILLREKINAVLDLIDTSATTRKQLQKVRVALDAASHATGSITTLHGYFHNVHMTPTQSALREAWDTWEDYLRLLHAART